MSEGNDKELPGLSELMEKGKSREQIRLDESGPSRTESTIHLPAELSKAQDVSEPVQRGTKQSKLQLLEIHDSLDVQGVVYECLYDIAFLPQPRYKCHAFIRNCARTMQRLIPKRLCAFE